MKKRCNRKGFTLAEVLVVVAILVVLASVGVIAIFSHMRSMQQLEMDGHAKEIFIAAQNHLALAESQGYLGMSAEEGQFGTASSLEEDGVQNVYYFLVSGASAFSNESVLTQMLPFASVDESARVSGSYIIRYQKNPGQILDVFYVDPNAKHGYDYSFKEDDYETLFTKGYTADKDKRRSCGDDLKKGAVIGYYGGVPQSEIPRGKQLLAPTVEIFNAEVLRIKVTDNNTEEQAGNQVILVIHGDTSEQDMQFSLSESAFEITLDDVTAAASALVTANTGHFYRYNASFIPGENLTVTATAFNNTLLTNIAESAPQKTNSLFAAYDTRTKTAMITNIRHLLNLDPRVSGIGTVVDGNRISVEKAVQTGDLSWKEFTDYVGKASSSITSTGGTTVEKTYFPVAHVNSLSEYDGGGFKITGVTVDCASNAGLFAKLNGCDVKNLTLVDFNIKTSSGNAGALAGEADGSNIESVLVYNSKVGGKDGALAGDDVDLKIEGSAAVGGLVGLVGGTNKKVETSAVAVYVESTGTDGAAGGLIGALASDSSITIDSSYVGGHTEGAKFVGLDAEETAVTHINILSNHGPAGGLVGDTSDATLNLTYCYSTASVASKADTSVGVGGLVGNADGTLTAATCYSAGLVTGEINTVTKKPYASISPLVGKGEFGSASTNVEYLGSVSPLADLPGYTFASAVSAGDTERNMLPADNTDAVVYDRTLAYEYQGKFSFATVRQLGGKLAVGITDIHYGDWQFPTMEILHYTLTNSDTLFADITFKENTRYVTMVLFGETSKAATAFLLQLSDSQSNATIVDTGVLSNDDRDITWRGEPDDSVVRPAFSVDAEKKTLTITFDDITTAKGHFTSIFPNLIPGENVTLFAAGGKCSWGELQTLRTKVYPEDMEDSGEIIALSDNSLFAKTESLTTAETAARTEDATKDKPYSAAAYMIALADMSSAEIVNFRHLQNLDYTVSNVADGVTSAKLLNNLSWGDPAQAAYPSITSISQKAVTNSFCGIYTKALTEFDGDNKTISNLVVDGSKMDSDFTDKGLYSAGLFRYVESGLTVKNLHLVKPIITAGRDDTTKGNAGAIVGEVAFGASLTIDTVLAEPGETVVHADQMTVSASDGAAGGLVGLGKGAISINNSAAVLLVNGGTAAGGLVGSSENSVTLTASYVGGHTEGAKYTTWNVSSGSGYAGGLIGKFASDASITNCFTTASVSAGTGKAGGLVGAADGTFSELNYVYTVAPVNGVKALGESGGNGALVGTTGSNINNGFVFFLPDVYEDPLTESDLIGSTGKSFSDTDKVLSADVFKSTEPTIAGLSGSNSELEMHTTTYDNKLEGMEYPFKISTSFAGNRHFYGDWAPPVNSESSQVVIHFLIQTPDSNPVDFVMDTGSGAAVSTTTIYVQMEPFSGAQVTVPTMPYKSGYNYGSNKGILSLSYTDSNYLDASAAACVWQVYIGDQTVALKGGAAGVNPGARYSRNGGPIELTEDDLIAALPEGAASGHLTLVAYYYQLENQYKVELMDNQAVGEYATWGGLQFVNQPGFNSHEGGDTLTSLSYKNVYKYDGNTAFNAAYGNLIIPKLNVPGYTFLGWYSGTGADAVQVFSCKNGVLKLETPDAVINDNVTLYARYREKEEAEIKLAFVLVQGTQNIPLSTEFTLKFDKSLGFDQDIDLPGYNSTSGVTGVKVLKKTGTQETTILDLSSGGSSATSLEVWFNRLKVKETDENGNEVEVEKNTDRSIHIRTGIQDSYADKYTVYFQGNVDTVGVVVMHELDHTSYTSATATYAYAATPYYEKVDELLILQGEQLKISEHPGWYPDNPLGETTLRGFEEPRLEEIFIYPYNTDNAAKYGVTSSTVSGKNIEYIVVVPYERSKYELRFVNLGMSQGEEKFQWKTLYVGEAIKLPQTSATSPQLYGGNYTFKDWQYEYEDGSLITQKPTVMPDHNLVLRAQYEGQPVDYTVLVWVENPDPDKNADGTPKTNPDGSLKYSYTQVGRKVITGGAYPGEIIKVSLGAGGEVNVGTDRIVPTAIGIAGIVDKTVGGETVRLSPYIEYSHSDDNVTADGKGTTKFNVYYDRKVYRLRFDVGYSEPTGSASYQPITEYVEGDVYGDIGTGNSHNYVPLTKIGDSWYYTDNTNGAYFGKTGDTYFPLRFESLPSEIYKAAHRYQETEEDGDVRFWVDTSGGHGEFKQLIVDKRIEGESIPEKTAYMLTNTVKAGEEYLIVSINNAGGGYALTYTGYGDNSQPSKFAVTVLAANDSFDAPYIETNGIEDRGRWTVSGSTNSFKFYNYDRQNYYVRRNGQNDSLDVWTGDSNNTWTWEGNNNRLIQKKNNNKWFYLRYSSNSFSLTDSARSVYLFVKTTIPAQQAQTTYHYYLNEEDKLNDIEYTGTRYIELGSDRNEEYTEDDLVELNGELYYLDTAGIYGRADTYIPTVYVRTDTTPTYYKVSDDSKYEGTVYRFTAYSKQLYQLQQTHKYYVSTINGKENYNNYLTTHVDANSAGSNTKKPFTYRTAKSFVKDSYNGTRKETKNGTEYTIYYWDIVAKYGSNIKDMWPTTFSDQSGNGFIGWVINPNANDSSGSIKDAREILNEKLFVGAGIAQTRNADGVYVGEPSQVLKGRYASVGRHFVSRYYFKDPDTGAYPAEPKYEYVYNSQAGKPHQQKVGDVDGYAQQDYDLLDSRGRVISPKTENSWSAYEVTLVLPPKTSVSSAMIFKYYFDPIPYNINFEYVGDLVGTIPSLGSNGVIADVPFGRHIGTNDTGMVNYAYTEIPGLNTNEYSWDGNWYDNEGCIGDPFFKNGDTDYNKTRTMPNGELTLYAKVVHKPVIVTLNLGTVADGETVTMNGGSGNYVNSTWPWQDPVSDLLLDSSGGFKAEFTPARTAPDDADYVWKFVGWSTKSKDATKDDEYVYAQPQMTALTLYPIWEQEEEPRAATVYVTYQYLNDDNQYVAFETSELPESAKTTVTVHPNNPDAQIKVGDYFSMTAPELNGYTPVNASVGPVLVNAEEFKDQVIFKYRKTSWDITVNYYLQFTSVEPEKWLSDDAHEVITSGTFTQDNPFATATVPADSEYYLMGYEAPTGSGLDWLNNYRFDHYVYDGQPCYSEYVTVHPDATTNKATVAVYLTPETDSILIPDLVCPYIGESYANYSAGNPIDVPDSVGICQIHYLYYNANGEKLDDDEVVNAGAYGMRAYITVSAGGGNYLIWQSVGATPPLHLYIQRRVVILYSAVAEDTYSDNKVLQAPTVYYRPYTAAMTSTNKAKEGIDRYYDSNDPHYLDLQDYSDTNPGNAGFVKSYGNDFYDDQYFDWEFSASSFRREIGTSLNIFTYKVTDQGKALGMENNYYFYVCFGTLTVK